MTIGVLLLDSLAVAVCLKPPIIAKKKAAAAPKRSRLP